MDFYNINDKSLNFSQIVFPRSQSMAKMGEAVMAALGVMGGAWGNCPINWGAIKCDDQAPGQVVIRTTEEWWDWMRAVADVERGAFIRPQEPQVFEKGLGEQVLTWDDGRGREVPSLGHSNWWSREVGLHIPATPYLGLYLVVKEWRSGVGPARVEAVLMWVVGECPNPLILKDTADLWEKSWQAAQEVGVS